MNWLDVVILLVLLTSLVSGFRTGLARVVIGIASAAIGLLVAFWFYRMPGAALLPYVHDVSLANALGFFALFALCIVAGSLLALLLSRLFQWIGLSWFDHLLGGVAGLVRGAFVAAVLVAAIVAFSPSASDVLAGSRFLPYATGVSTTLTELAPHDLREAFQQRIEHWRHPRPARKIPQPETI